MNEWFGLMLDTSDNEQGYNRLHQFSHDGVGGKIEVKSALER
jgi:hypothetical protein